jgi:hypothetical protein
VNAQLTAVRGTVPLDDYGVPVEGGGTVKFTGQVPCTVVDRVMRALVPGGGVDRAHVTQVWLPGRLIADAGGYLALEVGDVLEVDQDGAPWRYRVLEWADWGQRQLGSPSSIRVEVERTPAT